MPAGSGSRSNTEQPDIVGAALQSGRRAVSVLKWNERMTTDPSIVRALGDIEGTVRNMREQWKSQDDNANAGRRALYERFDTVISKMGEVAHKIDGVTQDVAEMKNEIDTNIMPTIEAYKAEIARKIGAMAMGKIFWGMIVAVGSSVAFAVHEILLYIGGGPKHG